MRKIPYHFIEREKQQMFEEELTKEERIKQAKEIWNLQNQ